MAFFLLACSQNEKEKTTQSETTQVDTVQKQAPLTQTSQEKTPLASEDKVEEKAQALTPSAIETKVEEKVQEVVVSSKDVEVQAESLEKNVTKELQAKVTQAKESVATSSVDGATLYKACASCHGEKAQKQALNKSQVIQGWESSKTIASLKGYKDGSYGGPMKAMMKTQVTKLSDKEIEALAHYISGL